MIGSIYLTHCLLTSPLVVLKISNFQDKITENVKSDILSKLGVNTILMYLKLVIDKFMWS